MKIRNSVITAILAVILICSTTVSFAYNSDSVLKKNNTTSGLTSDKSEKESIKKYGYYKGKNATKIPVITYHSVVSNKDKKKKKYRRSSLVISQGTFNKQMKWLKSKGYRSINCEEFYLWYKGKIKLPPKSVLITFDDGHYGVVKYALPVLRKYNMKGTSFVIGGSSKNNKKGHITYSQIKRLQRKKSRLEFQSHTYNLHRRFSSKGDYGVVKKDAIKQKDTYGFDYIAYPYGRNTPGMIKAYKDTGIKLAFTYGNNGYATRKQNVYQIRRIKISGTQSFAKFKSWFK